MEKTAEQIKAMLKQNNFKEISFKFGTKERELLVYGTTRTSVLMNTDDGSIWVDVVYGVNDMHRYNMDIVITLAMLPIIKGKHRIASMLEMMAYKALERYHNHNYTVRGVERSFNELYGVSTRWMQKNGYEY